MVEAQTGIRYKKFKSVMYKTLGGSGSYPPGNESCYYLFKVRPAKLAK